MQFLSTVIPVGTEECNEALRTRYLDKYWNDQHKPFAVGDQFIYVEVKWKDGRYRLVNCTITVRDGEQKP